MYKHVSMFGIGITAKWKRARVLFESQQVNTLRNPVRHFRFPSCDIPYVVSGRLPQSIVEPVSNFDLSFYLIFFGIFNLDILFQSAENVTHLLQITGHPLFILISRFISNWTIRRQSKSPRPRMCRPERISKLL